jgi:hypothetical protein
MSQIPNDHQNMEMTKEERFKPILNDNADIEVMTRKRIGQRN